LAFGQLVAQEQEKMEELDSYESQLIVGEKLVLLLQFEAVEKQRHTEIA
jgi:hypothetical protein